MKGAERELDSLLKNNSIIFVKKADWSPKLTPLPTMMVCRRKRNESNEVVLHKCHMVAGGHRQVEAVHYTPPSSMRQRRLSSLWSSFLLMRFGWGLRLVKWMSTRLSFYPF
jgi:hypothetical protein